MMYKLLYVKQKKIWNFIHIKYSSPLKSPYKQS